MNKSVDMAKVAEILGVEDGDRGFGYRKYCCCEEIKL